jgi:small subunit ribosomal protein S3
MSVVKKIIQDNILKVKVDELLAEEYEQAGYGGITLTKTPLGTQINLYAMRPGRVIGKRGSAIRKASERLEFELGLPNPQITVIEVEVPELDPRIMAARIANALERGIHYRRALFWSLRRTMEAGALGCEILLKGKLRSDRGRYEKVVDGFIPKAGEAAQRYVRRAVIHVKQKKGTFGVTVVIVPPDAKFPDKIDLSGLPVIEYPEDEIVLPEGVEPDAVEGEAVVGEELPEPVEALEPTAALEPAEGEAEATPAEVSEAVEPAEASVPEVETPAVASEPEVETQTEETQVAETPEEVVSEAPTVAEEPEAIQESTPVEEAPKVEDPAMEETTPVEEAPKVEAVEAPVEPEPVKVEEPKTPKAEIIEAVPAEPAKAETPETPDAEAVEESTPVEETPEIESPAIKAATSVEETPKAEVVEAPVEPEAEENEESPETSDDSETKKEK